MLAFQINLYFITEVKASFIATYIKVIKKMQFC